MGRLTNTELSEFKLRKTFSFQQNPLHVPAAKWELHTCVTDQMFFNLDSMSSQDSMTF